ncbi:hypothetical protein FCV25MIE_08786 [Fagus crenata]
MPSQARPIVRIKGPRKFAPLPFLQSQLLPDLISAADRTRASIYSTALTMIFSGSDIPQSKGPKDRMLILIRILSLSSSSALTRPTNQSTDNPSSHNSSIHKGRPLRERLSALL